MDKSFKEMIYFFIVCIVINIALTAVFPNFIKNNQNYYLYQYDLNE